MKEIDYVIRAYDELKALCIGCNKDMIYCDNECLVRKALADMTRLQNELIE